MTSIFFLVANKHDCADRLSRHRLTSPLSHLDNNNYDSDDNDDKDNTVDNDDAGGNDDNYENDTNDGE